MLKTHTQFKMSLCHCVFTEPEGVNTLTSIVTRADITRLNSTINKAGHDKVNILGICPSVAKIKGQMNLK